MISNITSFKSIRQLQNSDLKELLSHDLSILRHIKTPWYYHYKTTRLINKCGSSYLCLKKSC